MRRTWLCQAAENLNAFRHPADLADLGWPVVLLAGLGLIYYLSCAKMALSLGRFVRRDPDIRKLAWAEAVVADYVNAQARLADQDDVTVNSLEIRAMAELGLGEIEAAVESIRLTEAGRGTATDISSLGRRLIACAVVITAPPEILVVQLLHELDKRGASDLTLARLVRSAGQFEFVSGDVIEHEILPTVHQERLPLTRATALAVLGRWEEAQEVLMGARCTTSAGELVRLCWLVSLRTDPPSPDFIAEWEGLHLHQIEKIAHEIPALYRDDARNALVQASVVVRSVRAETSERLYNLAESLTEDASELEKLLPFKRPSHQRNSRHTRRAWTSLIRGTGKHGCTRISRRVERRSLPR